MWKHLISTPVHVSVLTTNVHVCILKCLLCALENRFQIYMSKLPGSVQRKRFLAAKGLKKKTTN